MLVNRALRPSVWSYCQVLGCCFRSVIIQIFKGAAASRQSELGTCKPPHRRRRMAMLLLRMALILSALHWLWEGCSTLILRAPSRVQEAHLISLTAATDPEWY